jgi:hypothetical protein
MTNTSTHHNMDTMDSMDSMLTLAIPLSLTEEICDFLLLNPQWASGFSIVDAQGMGQGAALLTAIEKVQGRSKRKLIMVVGEQAQLMQLVTALGEKIKNSDVAYWVTPVNSFGRF